MEFYIPGDEKDKYQLRMRVPYETYETMMQDIDEFYNTPEKQHISRFLNRIFTNFYTESECSIERYRNSLLNEYNCLLNDNALAERISEYLIQKKKAEILKKFPFPKTSFSQQFRYTADNKVREMMKYSKDSIHYTDEKSYLSAMIQEYCSLPHEKREHIFFKNELKVLNKAITDKNIIIIKTTNDTLSFKPASVVKFISSQCSYLIGYANSMDKNTEEFYTLRSIRIKNIFSVTDTEENFSFSDAEKAEIKKRTRNNSDIPYLASDEELIKVRLSEYGYKKLYKSAILIGKPRLTEIETSDNGSYVLSFHCPSFQAYQYFIKFGKDAEIIAPIELRQKFADIHTSAAEFYK